MRKRHIAESKSDSYSDNEYWGGWLMLMFSCLSSHVLVVLLLPLLLQLFRLYTLANVCDEMIISLQLLIGNEGKKVHLF